MLAVLISFSGWAGVFNYPAPLCTNGTPVAPQISGYPLNGIYSSSAGLDINTTNGTIDPSQSQPGTYVVTYNWGGGATTTQVTIHAIIPASIVSNPILCLNSTASSLVVQADTAGISSYTWGPAQGNANAPLILYPPYNPNNTYSLKVTDVNGCRSQTSFSITVITPPPISISGNGTVCAGKPDILTANGTFNPVWSTGSTVNPITVSPSVTTTYTLFAAASGCTATATKTVVVSKVILSAANQTVCSGKTTTLTAVSNPSAGVTFLWFPGAVSGRTVIVSPSSPTSYTVVAQVAIVGCTFSAVSKVSVSPSFTPVTGFSYRFPICTGDLEQKVLPILGPGFNGNGTFSISPATTGFNDTTGQVSVPDIPPGTYLVKYHTNAVGCTVATNSTAPLNIGQTGQVDLITDVVMFKGASATLSVSGGNSFNWSPNQYISCTDCDSPEITPPETMQYCVSSDLCINGGCVNVTVLCKNPGDLSVPNAFTPDGDGNNDKFCLQGWDECNKKFEILIFDRWGEKVYQSKDPSFCWDGVYNGKVLNAGVYTYAITATFEIIPRIDRKGTITIMR